MFERPKLFSFADSRPKIPTERFTSPPPNFGVCQEPDPLVIKEVQERATRILREGPAPDWLFTCQVEQGPIQTFRYANEKAPALLFFTTPYAAADYMRAARTPTRHVGKLNIDALPALAEKCKSSGIDTFVLNRCPRCNVMLLWPTRHLLVRTEFLYIWALDRAVRSCRGEMKVREFRELLQNNKASETLTQQRAVLEMIRDHIDCGIPYVHQLIALIAFIQKDEEAKRMASERLKEFGPQFEGTAEFSIHHNKHFAEALVGLMLCFGQMAKRPQGKIQPDK